MAGPRPGEVLPPPGSDTGRPRDRRGNRPPQTRPLDPPPGVALTPTHTPPQPHRPNPAPKSRTTRKHVTQSGPNEDAQETPSNTSPRNDEEAGDMSPENASQGDRLGPARRQTNDTGEKRGRVTLRWPPNKTPERDRPAGIKAAPVTRACKRRGTLRWFPRGRQVAVVLEALRGVGDGGEQERVTLRRSPKSTPRRGHSEGAERHRPRWGSGDVVTEVEIGCGRPGGASGAGFRAGGSGNASPWDGCRGGSPARSSWKRRAASAMEEGRGPCTPRWFSMRTAGRGCPGAPSNAGFRSAEKQGLPQLGAL